MSWESYIDDQLIGSDKISKAAIIGKQGGIWSNSTGYDILPEEQQFIGSSLLTDSNQSKPDSFKINGDRLYVLIADSRHAAGRKGVNHVVIFSTNRTFIIGQCEASIQLSEAMEVVGNLAEPLKCANY